MSDNQFITTNKDDRISESGHLSRHDCKDKPKNKSINGQSGQNTAEDSGRAKCPIYCCKK